jgi:hypothetical protein
MLIILTKVEWTYGVHPVAIKSSLLEVWFYMNGPPKLAALISSKQFFGLKFSFE